MGEWYKVEPRPYSPCDNCETGHCGISQKVVGGVLYQKTDDCHETCEIYKEHLNDNTPKTYASITNKDRERMRVMASRGW